MNFPSLFDRYERLAAGADKSFDKIKDEYGKNVQCKVHCTDCCHAVFGLFLIEAAYLKIHFNRLGRKERRAILSRCHRADKELKQIEIKLEKESSPSGNESDLLGKFRVRCPLLNDKEECELYPYPPITCRVYGIPTSIEGKARVCHKSGFKDKATYSTFDLDGVFKELYRLSRDLLENAGSRDLKRAELLFSLSSVLSTPLKSLMTGIPEEPHGRA